VPTFVTLDEYNRKYISTSTETSSAEEKKDEKVLVSV